MSIQAAVQARIYLKTMTRIRAKGLQIPVRCLRLTVDWETAPFHAEARARVNL
jgi:hypothetical protein